MKAPRLLKGLMGFCQAKGCTKRHICRVDMEIDGKKMGSTKLCEIHMLALFEAKQVKEGEQQ